MFQPLIGTIKTYKINNTWYDFEKFQPLIGTIKTGNFDGNRTEDSRKFQPLIGTIKTCSWFYIYQLPCQFQPLIGTIKTKFY